MSKHRLVAIGDSLTQGFTSGAIRFTDRSYPAIIAREMGLGDQEFLYPPFHSKGWVPLNLWERSPGGRRTPFYGVYHNLAVLGFEVQDVYDLTAGHCEDVLARSTGNPILQVLKSVMYRMALRVLNPGQLPHLSHQTQISAAKQLAADGGIENLILWIGANNALKTVTQLRLQETDENAFTLPADQRDYTLWRPDHFKTVYDRLADEVEAIGAERVFVANVPHVTIPPITHGTGGRLSSDRRYFRYYTRPWIREEFDPSQHPHLTGEQVQQIDQTIDAFNRVIEAHVKRRENWHLADICSVVERLAYRRYQEEPGVGPPPGGPYELPEELRALSPAVDSRLLLTKNGKRIQGGLFSLDGVHPTSIGYGIVAQELIHGMQRAGVPFKTPAGQQRQGEVRVNFHQLAALDALVTHPPMALDYAVQGLQKLEGWVHLSRRLAALG